MSTWVSGSISSMASAAASSSRDGEHADPVAAAELVDDRRQVGRVELGQALVGDAQLDAGDRPLDRVDVLPVDVALRDLAVEAAGDSPPRPLDAEPAQQARTAPTSTATRWSAPSTSSRRRSLTRTTLRPSMSTIWLSSRSRLRRISLGRWWNLLMSMAVVRSVAPPASREATDCQGRKISRPLVLTTRPVTGGYRSPMATIRSATVPIGSPCSSRTGRPIAWLR